MEVTVHILPGLSKKDNFSRLFSSLKPLLPVQFIHHTDQCLWRYREPLAKDTKWWMYFYNNEWLSDELVASLPSYFSQSHSDFDSYTLTKEVTYSKGNVRYFNTPRIFANYVGLRNGSLMPDLRLDLRPEFILDGFLHGEIG